MYNYTLVYFILSNSKNYLVKKHIVPDRYTYHCTIKNVLGRKEICSAYVQLTRIPRRKLNAYLSLTGIEDNMGSNSELTLS